MRLLLLLCLGLAAACAGGGSMKGARTFHDDVSFLRQHGPVEVLEASHGARVALSGKYQGRVMTSAFAPDRESLGWINRDFISSGQTGTRFDNYGGEDRFWLGPEAGQFGLYFPAGASFTLDAWVVPAALNEGAWTVTRQSAAEVVYTRAMQVTNYLGTVFDLRIDRTVRLLEREDLARHLGVIPAESLDWVAFETVNTVTNTGAQPWTRESGMPSIWILGMFQPFGTSYAVVPFRGTAAEGVVNDRYFGEIPADRLEVRDGYVLFKCDGGYRSKIGIGPKHAVDVLGSFSSSARLLTLAQMAPAPADAPYVNSMWEIQQDPYGGDVVNSYNDGPTDPGKPALGGFYELETSSPALALGPGESFTHTQRTVHLSGPMDALDPVADRVLGITASEAARGLARR